jgi:hypothetical protein
MNRALHSSFLSHSSKRRWWELDWEEEEDHELHRPRTRVRNEVIVIDNDEDPKSTRGTGTANGPLYFAEWTTGTIIPEADNGKVFHLDEEDHDDVEDDDIPYKALSRLRNRLDPSPSPHPQADLHRDGLARNTNSISRYFDFEDEDGLLKEHEEQPATQVMDEEPTIVESDEDVPGLSFSQSSDPPDTPTTPSSSQEVTVSFGYKPQESAEFPPEGNEDPQTYGPTLSPTEDELKKDDIKFRKEAFYLNWAPRNLEVLKTKLLRYRPGRVEPGKCWLYDGVTGENQSVLGITVSFPHQGLRLKYNVNAAMVALLVAGGLTEDAISGIVKQAWHASHLCGNWRCTNPAHIVAESGSVNSTRNSCLHGHRTECDHQPPCMSELKIMDAPAKEKQRERDRALSSLTGSFDGNEMDRQNNVREVLEVWETN